MKRPIAAIAAAALACAAGAALVWMTPGTAACADDPARCRSPETRLDDEAYLRALSLDLRGVVPSPEEYARVRAEGGVSDALIDEWLATDAFAARVVRRHRELLWPNISNGQILNPLRGIGPVTTGGEAVWQQLARDARTTYRGGAMPAGCLNEPARFDAAGNVLTRAVGDHQLEGYVLVRPYWDLSIELKVCAFDAQARRVSPRGNDCGTNQALGDPGCGCGPNLRWCWTGAVRDAMLASFADELEQRIAAHVRSDEPYPALLTSRRAFTNGAITYYWRHHRLSGHTAAMVPEPLDVAALPPTDIEATGPDAVSFRDREWVLFELPEQHAGLLTHPTYLLRFQTNRARAARFADAFLCEPFAPPPGGIPLENRTQALQPDVQQRPGCNYCHALLEPTAAHWGRWSQGGGAFLSLEAFPEFRQECLDCARGLEQCSDACNRHYITRAISPDEVPNLGRLRPFEFLRPEHRANVDSGPAALVRGGLADGRFTTCAVKRTAEWLLGRELEEREQPWARELTAEFLGSDFRYRQLVRAVVTSETYRRAR